MLVVSGLAGSLARPATQAAHAAAWARLVEAPVTVSAATSTGSLAVASAGFETPAGRGRLAVDAGLIARVVAQLTGHPAAGPAPLTPAEEGAFAYLAASWLKLIPDACLTWVHGGEPTWPVPQDGDGPVLWRVQVGDAVGLAQWWLPTRILRVEGEVRCALPLRVGALIPLSREIQLLDGEVVLGEVEIRDGRARCVSRTARVSDAELPVMMVDAGSFGAPEQLGEVLPFRLEDPPVVRLRQGKVLAVGVLTQLEGRQAVQVTQVYPD